MFRARSAQDCLKLPEKNPVVFMNTHPNEIGTPQLIESLEEFHQLTPRLTTVLEIHEGSVTDPATISELREFLHSLGMKLAYDDFGSGQARLLELAEVPPDFLKFDISMIRNIDTASAAKLTVLERLVAMAIDIDISPIAEGVESEAEAEICRNVGFTYAQGFLFGTPAPADGLPR
jgi:EAL domain-containing protein (putative c-di-GMP-specific phosphodiesterase class I)